MIEVLSGRGSSDGCGNASQVWPWCGDVQRGLLITRLLFDGRRAVKSPMVGGADQLRRSCLPTRALLALA